MNNEKEVKTPDHGVNEKDDQTAQNAVHEEVPNDTEQVVCEYSKEDVDLLNNRLKELENKMLISQAELVNYRKRKDEEVSNMLKYANQDIILEIIGVLDNFERATKVEASEEVKKYLVGFNMIYNQLVEILKKYGVSEIDVLGKPFDHNTCEALMVSNDKDKANEEVVEVLMKGYNLKDRVIRPAKVKVNQI